MKDQPEEPHKDGEKFSISIHQLIEGMQSTHGLRHEDFKQYHGYCSRRLHRLRHHKAVRRELVHSATYVPGEKMRRNAYCPRDDPDTYTHENMLLVVLVESERAWAHANELKTLLRVPPPKSHEKSNASPGQIRQHALKRLKRAKQMAEKLEGLCAEHGCDTTQEEAKAYASWMRGSYALDRSDWKTAYEEFQSALRICRSLADANSENLELRDLFSSRAANTIKPLLKYCLYELQETGGDVSGFEDNEDEANAHGARSGTIVFRDKQIPITNKAIKLQLVKIQGLVEEYNKSKDDRDLVSLFTAYDDTVAMVQGDLRQIQKMKAGPSVDAKRSELEYLLGYVKNEKLQLSMKRYRSRIADCTGSSALAQLYDALLQDARAVCQLAGPEFEDDFLLEANAEVLRIRAFRAFYVAQLYAQMDKAGQALSLLEQASLLCSRAAEEIAACEGFVGSPYLDELDSLSGDIMGLTVRIKASACLGTTTQLQTGFFSNLDSISPKHDWGELGTEPMPCKPSFFDIAWNHASRNLRLELNGHIQRYSPKKAAGILSWFTS